MDIQTGPSTVGDIASMVSWQQRRNPDDPPEKIEADTLAYMATTPAWRDHPRPADHR